MRSRWFGVVTKGTRKLAFDPFATKEAKADAQQPEPKDDPHASGGFLLATAHGRKNQIFCERTEEAKPTSYNRSLSIY